jgi:peptidoglycan/xylan/chitin deacetylase (PgdA/CDA1 family)
MSTVNVTTSADAAVNDGTAAELSVLNSGAFSVFIQPWNRKLRPGERAQFTPEGQAVTARGDDGATTLDVTATAAATTDLGHLAGGAVQRTGETGTVDLSGATLTLPSTTAGLTKTTVGLPNVANTSDAAKPVSTAQQAALDAKVAASGQTAAVDISAAAVTFPATTTAKDATSAATMGLWPASRQIFPQIKETVISAFQASHGWTKSGTGTGSDDTTDYLLGSQSYKMITDGAGGSSFLSAPAGTYDLSTKNLVLAVKVDDFTHYGDLQIRLTSTAYTDYAYCKPIYTSLTQRWAEAGQWAIITISRAELVAGPSWGNGQWQYGGTKSNVNWSAITGIRFKFTDDAAGTCTFRVNLLGTFPQPATAALCLMFDDSRATHYTVAKPYLDKYRLPATSAIIGESVLSGSGAYMTTAQARALKDTSKWSIIGHAYGNVAGSLAHQNGYDGITYADGETDVQRLKHWMNANGFRGTNLLALPHGSWSINTPVTSGANTDVLNMLAKYYDAVRTTYSNTLETYPPAAPMKLRSYTVTNTDTAQNLLDVVDQGIAGKNLILMQFHNLVTPATGNTDVTPTVFQTFIDGIKTRSDAGTLLVRGLHEVLQYGMV